MKKLFIILLLTTVVGSAQNIAYVDSRYILENIPEFATTQEELNNVWMPRYYEFFEIVF